MSLSAKQEDVMCEEELVFDEVAPLEYESEWERPRNCRGLADGKIIYIFWASFVYPSLLFCEIDIWVWHHWLCGFNLIILLLL